MNEPIIAQKQPYVRDETARTVKWCACGRSADQPYCDGSHKGSEHRPLVIELAEGRTVSWCGCKHSGNKPFCDGTHRSL
ncbi:MAG TPA: CDGSH iron-sulfur domain-containing protein [candidate division Zixibacteria bacterium]|jgi:CDGSH-type Zn-finger protein